jgi:hypothetical protein
LYGLLCSQKAKNKDAEILKLGEIQHWDPRMFWIFMAVFVPAAGQILPHD